MFRHARVWLGAAAAVALGAAGYFYAGNSPSGQVDHDHVAHAMQPGSGPGSAADKASITPAKKLWVCPMHPQVIRDEPDDLCPICGMDLVEMAPQGDHDSAHSHGVHIDTASQQRLGVRLAPVEWKTLSEDIHSYGNVVADKSLAFTLTSKLEGVVRKIHVNTIGQHVDEGQPIYDIYSAELLKAQFEYVDLVKEKDVVMGSMMGEDAHRDDASMSAFDMMEVQVNAKQRNLYAEKFEYWDLKPLVEQLNTTHRPKEIITIRAPRSGFVTEIAVQEGSAIKPMDPLFSFVDTSRVWVDVPLFPDQLAWVKDGDRVTLRLPKSGISEISTRLKLVTPLIDSATRTVQARLSIENENSPLLIGSFLDVVIHTRSHKALAVPRSAVMRTGKGDWVMLAEGKGHFTPVKVVTGVETTDSVEIIKGLKAGDQVAVNGQFLLDAAASMNDTAQRMQNNH